ncbi:metallophosphoesterase [Microbacterium sp. NPDC019599]|uniref:metallophosphoesterase family protein n=1 Tax=Microbacterium sp. NPDC019599 TaxID=3154690 RepID=UPI00340B20DF
MSTRLVLIADTHIPRRAQRLPDAVLAAIDDADLVIHAGDWVEASVFEELSKRADVLGVFGNNDSRDLRERLPEIARRDVEGVRIAVTHETGPARDREARMDVIFPGVDVLVFGHSHIPWDTTSPRGMRLLNPGSPTDRRRQPQCTFMTAVADDGAIRDVELVPIT